MTDLTERLRECPFCGAPGNMVHEDRTTMVMIMCGADCELVPQTDWQEPGKAIAAWNKRPALETLTQEVERLRGLLIDPGDPAWEDARAVLVAELRKSDMGDHAEDVSAGRSLPIPSWIALNLIAHSRKSLTQENARLREEMGRALSAPLTRLADIERDGMPEGMDPLSDDDGLMIHVRDLRAARKALGGGDE